MQSRSKKIILAGAIASIVLALAIGTATASRSLGLEPSNALVRFTSSEFQLQSMIIEMSCPLTIDVQFSTSITKAPRTVAGRVLGVRTANERCRNSLGTRSSYTLLRAEEWTFFYEGFLGTLPTISGVRLRLERVQLLKRIDGTLGGNTGCLVTGSVMFLAPVERGAISSIVATRESGTEVNLATTLEGICDSRDVLGGTFRADRSVRVALL